MSASSSKPAVVNKFIEACETGLGSIIERVALDPNLPLQRLEQMLAFRERMADRAREDDERAAKRAYFAAMSLCQAELPVVIRLSRNKQTGSTYADLAAIEEQAMPIIHRHGFAVSFQPDGFNDRGELRVAWQICHREGHYRDGVGEIPVDGVLDAQGKVTKTGTQAFGSTATYGRRYLLCMLFNISTGDDRDGNKPDQRASTRVSKTQVKVIQRLLAETGSDENQFCKLRKIAAIPELATADYEDATRLLYQRRAKQRSARPA